MKICVLGNSQAACLKSAWDKPENRPPNHQLTIFAAFGLSLANLDVAGKRLVPATAALRQNLIYTAGLGEVEASDYDAFLICGAGLGFRPIDDRLSHQVLTALTTDLVKTSLAYSLAGKVRRITDAPIYVMHAPLLDVRTAERVHFGYFDYADYFPLLTQAMDIPGTVLMKQPDQTITQGHFTKLEFSQDAVRLAVKSEGEGIRHKEDDYNHMNTYYGAVRLKDFFAKLDA